jgi:diguanylate cyclase (GGDEF)-like protein/PAS domain S-box-containing protein
MVDRNDGKQAAAMIDAEIIRPRVGKIALVSVIGLGFFGALSAIAQSAVAREPVLLAAWFTADRAILVLLILLALTLTIMAWVMTLRRRVQQQTHVIRRNRENELALEERYRRIFERNLTGLYIARQDGTIVDCNDACASILGFSSRESLLEHHERAELITRHFYDGAAGNGDLTFGTEHHIHRFDGKPGWVLSIVRPVQQNGDGATTLEGAVVDVTHRKLADERIEFLAYYDSLTGLPNRTLLQDRLAKALASARRHREKLAVLFLDVDGFKTINDSLGHSYGDLLLQQLATRLQSCAREQDTVCRLGGDEFLIVLGSVEEDLDAAVAAERIAREVNTPFEIQGQTLTVTCSIGISMFPEHGEDAETLIKTADAAMYSSKDGGRNTFRFFTEKLTAEALERLRLDGSLRAAVEEQQFFLMYQPEIDVDSGMISCWEALIRWQHPELGLVPPEKFIRVAENNGLIVPIGEWVLRTACTQWKRWVDSGMVTAPVAVNVSALQFRHEGFCRLVKRVLEDTCLAPEFLELELTESLLFSNEDVMFDILAELKAMGVRLAIDDFGTGYSSLSYLRQFPVSKLKIDRSFIRDLALNGNEVSITAAIINLAKCLKLRVTAEGVETEAQLTFLKKHGCDEVQGFFFSKPLTVAEVPAMPSRIFGPPPVALSNAITCLPF